MLYAGTFLLYFLNALQLIVLARVIVSWLPVSPSNKLIDFIYSISEPIFVPIRHLIKRSIFGGRNGGMLLDFSPMVAFLLISMLANFISRMLLGLGTV
ncbi:YggT family protein [Clostridiales bacterium F-3ap]|uniref:YggT family protein n=2 Tax=Anaerotalea alkaliphila TaxID=2662126 RepID=A0A7X5KPD7_9FIRM|nr:YggT family protein [Anaerotalea alkaliphila]